MWLHFALMTLDARATQAQIDDTETAFKAGASCVLLEQFNVVAELPDAEGSTALRDWLRESNEHFAKYRTPKESRENTHD
jgi:hypothetical protein